MPGLRITDLGNKDPLLTGALLGNEGLPSYTQKSSTSLPNGVSHSWEDVGPVRMGADNVLSMFSRSIYFFSCVRLFLTLWTVARQAFLSMEFSRQEYWSGSPVPFPGDLSDSGIEPRSPALQADSLPLIHQGSPTGWQSSTVKILNCEDPSEFSSLETRTSSEIRRDKYF